MSKVKLINEFCVYVRKFIAYFNQVSDDPDNESYHNRATIFVNNTPSLVIEALGPELFDHHAIIKGKNYQLIVEGLRNNNINDGEASMILEKIVKMLELAPLKDRDLLLQDINLATEVYIKYLIACK